MKVLVVYVTKSGNTKKLADKIYNTLECDKLVCSVEEQPRTEGYNLIYCGFPIHNKYPSREAIKFIRSLGRNQRVILLITHGIPNDSPIRDIQIENSISFTNHLNLLGVYACQGELSEDIAKIMIKSKNKEVVNYGQMRERTLGHPNENDLEGIVQFVSEIQKNYCT